MAELLAARGSGVAKIVTGVRGCGKSELLGMLADATPGAVTIDGWTVCWRDVLPGLMESPLDGRCVILDGADRIDGWRDIAAELLSRGADLYVGYSGPVPVEAPFPYTEIRVMPYAFSEYAELRGGDPDALLEDYLTLGGLPRVVGCMDRPACAEGVLESQFEAVYWCDIGNEWFHEEICNFMLDIVGSRTSVGKMARYISSNVCPIEAGYVESVVGTVERSMLMRRAPTVDALSGERLDVPDKFYAADAGYRWLNTFHWREDHLWKAVENAVHNELVFRHGEASVCSVGPYEVNFVAGGEFYQAVTDVNGERARDRAVRALDALPEGSRRTIVSYKEPDGEEYRGIRTVKLADWLMESGRGPGTCISNLAEAV